MIAWVQKGNKWGIRDGAVVRVLACHRCGRGVDPGVDAICALSLLFGSRSCSGFFFAGFSGFPPSTKTNISKVQFGLETVNEEPLRGYATANSHLFYLIFHRIRTGTLLNQWIIYSTDYYQRLTVESWCTNRFQQLPQLTCAIPTTIRLSNDVNTDKRWAELTI